MTRESPRIVVVEDDTSMSQAIERILRAGGYQPIVFASAEAAIESDDLAGSDCMILDIGLPGMSGLEMARQLAVSGDEIPTIFITAHDNTLAHIEANRLGAKGFLVKPFSGRALLGVVKKSLRGA